MLFQSTPGQLLAPPTPGSAGISPHVAALRPVVRAVIARTTHLPLSHPDVDEGVAETFRRVVEGVGRVRPGEPLGPWAAGIARHVALDYLRARRRDRARRADSEQHEPENLIVDPAPSPEETAGSAEELAAVRKVLAGLAEGPREAILAFHLEGQSYQTIAARFDVPMGTVATWIARGRKALGAVLRADRDSATPRPERTS